MIGFILFFGGRILRHLDSREPFPNLWDNNIKQSKIFYHALDLLYLGFLVLFVCLIYYSK